MNLKIQDGVAQINESLHTAAAERLNLDISSWLRPPNPVSNLTTARNKRQQDTGLWLLNSPIFVGWKKVESSFLWLHGKAGSGKTILSSTAIHCLFQERDTTTSIVYFYFDFQTRDKQLVEGLLNSIIVQLLSQEKHAQRVAERLYNSHSRGSTKPSIGELKITIRHMFDACSSTYLFIDALDECEDRADLLEFLEECRGWNQANVHVFATSRRETEIEDSLSVVATETIPLEDSVVDGDIQAYVQHQLRHDTKLSRWQADVRKEIETALVTKACGMFRWVECQLDAIRKCMKLGLLRKTLQSLPKTLDETYSRILNGIPEEYMEDARRILACLVYSFRPLSIQEIAETVAIVADGEVCYNVEERLCQPRDVLTICSGLVTVTESLRNTEVGFSQMTFQELRLAHFSVKEYLVSDRVVGENISGFALGERSTHEYLAKLCLRYLLYCHKEDICQDHQLLMNYYMISWEKVAFAPYAASFWSQHLRAAHLDEESSLYRVCLEMITQPSLLRDFMLVRRPWFDMEEVIIMQQYGCIKSREHAYDGILDMTVDVIPPLFYASLLGLNPLILLLLDLGEDINYISPRGTSLAAAAAGGHYDTVRLLIEKGADLNAQILQTTVQGSPKLSRTAIHEATYRRRPEVARLLLEKGADVTISVLCPGSNENHISDKTPYEAAHALHESDLIQLMIDAGAHPDHNHPWPMWQ